MGLISSSFALWKLLESIPCHCVLDSIHLQITTEAHQHRQRNNGETARGQIVRSQTPIRPLISFSGLSSF